MIDLYYWTTPNGHKITIFLEEAAIPYQIFPVNISKQEQFKPDFLKISPNNKIPAIIDHTPLNTQQSISIFESGAILLYLAEKYQRFIPSDKLAKIAVTEWLFWQVSGLGPMLGQANHFMHQAKDKLPYAINRYLDETKRLIGVLNKRLAEREYIADDYTIVDMACFPWVARLPHLSIPLEEYPHIHRWLKEVNKRPAIQRAYQVAMTINPTVAIPQFE
jgi:GST-like protein